MSEKQKEPTKKESFLIGLSNFLQKNRIFFIVLIVVLVLGLIAFTAVRESIKTRIEKSTIIAENAQDLYEKWATEIDEDAKKKYRDECFELVDEASLKYPNHYAAQRGAFLKGNIFFAEENWTEAGEAYENIFNNFPESYLAPISLNNAAVAYEELGENEKSLEMLKKITQNYEETFSDIQRIYFSLGRIAEKVENYTEAESAYNNLIDNYPNSNWTKLARNRIIALGIEGKIKKE